MSPKTKLIFQCQSCGHKSPKWLGRCPSCEAWNTFQEEVPEAPVTAKNADRSFRLPDQKDHARPVKLLELEQLNTPRIDTGLKELNRVLGGGLVPGALILVGGDPGIGKSTLLLSAVERIAQQNLTTTKDRSPRPVLYVSGEESLEQIKLRADRLGIQSEHVLLFAETRTDRIIEAVEQTQACVLVIDSIQAVYDPRLDSAPGTVSQVREVAARMMYLAKARGLPIFLVGHVTKDGAIAGPRVLEHMVDTVLYFESERGQPYRILRSHKNRFGSTQEIGVFEMLTDGLAEVTNPSELFLAERSENMPGSVVLPALEGTRPVLVEIQALVCNAAFGTPRRTCLGFDSNRAALLVAVLEQRTGLQILGSDIFVNVAGGMRLDDPAADLAVCLALASAFRNRALPARTVAFGEVGLSGELRAVLQPAARLQEAEKLGFQRAVLPKAKKASNVNLSKLECVECQKLSQALDWAFD